MLSAPQNWLPWQSSYTGPILAEDQYHCERFPLHLPSEAS